MGDKLYTNNNVVFESLGDMKALRSCFQSSSVVLQAVKGFIYIRGPKEALFLPA